MNRRVWGGNHTERGAAAPSILMTVLFTALMNGRDAMAFVSRTLCALPDHRPSLLDQSG